MERHDAMHTGQGTVTNPNAHDGGSIRWTFDPQVAHNAYNPNEPDAIPGGVAIGPDGKLFFGTVGGRFVCLNRNGVKQWQYPPSHQPPFHGGAGQIYCHPALAVGAEFPQGPMGPGFMAPYSVYFTTYDGYLVSFTMNGAFRWEVYLDNGVAQVNPVVGSNGVIYVPTADIVTGKVCIKGFDTSGHLVRLYEYPDLAAPYGEAYGSVAIGEWEGNLVLYFVDKKGRVHAAVDNGSFLMAKRWPNETFQPTQNGLSVTRGPVLTGPDGEGRFTFYFADFGADTGVKGLHKIQETKDPATGEFHPLRTWEHLFIPPWDPDHPIINYFMYEIVPFGGGTSWIGKSDGGPIIDTSGQIWFGTQYSGTLGRGTFIRTVDNGTTASGWEQRFDPLTIFTGQVDTTGCVAVDAIGDAYAVCSAIYGGEGNCAVISSMKTPLQTGDSEHGVARWSEDYSSNPGAKFDASYLSLDFDGTIYVGSGEQQATDGLLLAIWGP